MAYSVAVCSATSLGTAFTYINKSNQTVPVVCTTFDGKVGNVYSVQMAFPDGNTFWGLPNIPLADMQALLGAVASVVVVAFVARAIYRSF